MTKKVYIRSFGCQMNDYDAGKMADVLHAAEGYETTADPEQADLIPVQHLLHPRERRRKRCSPTWAASSI